MAAPALFTVLDGMIACKMDNYILFQGSMQAQRFAADLFLETVESTRSMPSEELDADIKHTVI